MVWTIVPSSACSTTQWAGGSTTQLFIYPPDAAYQKRDFLFRLSSAVARQKEEVPFTHLPGITRHLLVLRGNMQVMHQGRPPLTLLPYEHIDVFDGGLPTRSAGEAQDFNLMLSTGAMGKLCVVAQSGEENLSAAFTAFYCASGAATIYMPDGSSTVLDWGDTIVFERERQPDDTIFVRLMEESRLVRADICSK